jgi:hydrogenase maturation factor
VSSPAGPTCGPEEHCITCGDQASPMRVLSIDASGLADCLALDDVLQLAGGSETVDVALLAEVTPGDVVLVHAGTALTRLAPEEIPA